ncbi:MAG: YeeE/YedE thiosulfate transporter family protein [Verrucomicrobiota bacterium]|nr:YeeE/YedE thiosulfate transporter family protein [Verrucomicrobiota bacterium]
MSNENQQSLVSSLYERFLKNPWPYYTGAVILAVLNVALLAASGKPWGISGIFNYWGGMIVELFGGSVENWLFFKNPKHLKLLHKGFWGNPGSVRDFAIIIAALMTSLLAGQFKFKMIKSWRQFAAAVIGGLFMGYGAMIAFGCNIGGLFSGTASMSLHGWVFMVFIFLGGLVGSKILVKYLL